MKLLTLYSTFRSHGKNTNRNANGNARTIAKHRSGSWSLATVGLSPQAAGRATAALSRTVIIALLWAAVVAHSARVFREMHYKVSPCDFCDYYASAFTLRHGLDPYTADLKSVESTLGMQSLIPHATDPPTSLLAYEPLTFFAPPTAFWVWNALNFLALAMSVYLLLRGLEIETALILGALALLFPPVQWHFYSSQSKLPILLAMVLMMGWIKQDRYRATGAMLAFTGLLRAFPLVLGGYFLIRRQWRVLGVGAAVFVAGLVLTFGFVGLRSMMNFFPAMSFTDSKAFMDLNGNVTLTAFVSRLFWDNGYVGPYAELLRRSTVVAAWLCVLAFTTLTSYSTRNLEDRHSGVYCLWVVTSLMLFPSGHGYYLVLLLLPFAQLARAAVVAEASQRAVWTGIGSYLLTRNPALLSVLCEAIGVPVISHSPVATSLFFPLLLAYIATYWFVIDSGGRAEPVLQGSIIMHKQEGMLRQNASL